MTASATVGTGDRGVFIPIVPCRLLDTRPGSDNVGTRSTPLGPGEEFATAVHGPNGNCVVPTDAIAVAVNVAAVGGTRDSYLTLWPSGASRPLTANLNWVGGAPPTPNKVDVRLATDGRISLFNFAGQVDVVIDVFGYYADHHHDDRYYTEGEVDGALALKANTADVYTRAQVDAAIAAHGPVVFSAGETFTPPATQYTPIFDTVNVPKAGRLLLEAYFTGGLSCATNSTYFLWITVDGVLVPSSRRQLLEVRASADFDMTTFPATSLQGVTTGVMTAGNHLVEVRGACASGAASSTSLSGNGIVFATVLG